MVLYEKVFKDSTGIRIVTKPNESLGKETVHLQLRVSTAPNTVKMLSLELVDRDGAEIIDLEKEFFDALLQHKIKEVGKQCEKCKLYFLPNSPNQKQCDNCKESK